jgi:hypothetical protein
VLKERNHAKDLSGRPVSAFARSSSFYGPPEFWRTTGVDQGRRVPAGRKLDYEAANKSSTTLSPSHSATHRYQDQTNQRFFSSLLERACLPFPSSTEQQSDPLPLFVRNHASPKIGSSAE